MAPLNLYDASITPLLLTLKNLTTILDKAEAHTSEKGLSATALTESRISPDMHALPFQIQTACNTAKFLAVRVGGVANEPWDDDEKTLPELRARVTKTIAFLEAVDRAAFDGKEDAEVEFLKHKFTGLSYVTSFALPNFYFHAATAYDILRNQGVVIGKKDWLGV